MSSPKKRNSDNTYVVQSNDLIMRYSHNLNARQAKVLSFLISTIDTTDSTLPAIHVDYKTLMKLIGENKAIRGRPRIEAFLNKLSKTVFYSIDGDQISVFPWFSAVHINFQNTESVLFMFNPMLKQFLIQLSSNFTRYSLAEVLDFKLQYSFKLYDLFCAYSYKGELDLDLDELRRILNLENERESSSKFKQFKDLNRRVLSPSIEEINEKSNLHIECSILPSAEDGRKTKGVHFKISKKEVDQFVPILPSFTVNKFHSTTGIPIKEIKLV